MTELFPGQRRPPCGAVRSSRVTCSGLRAALTTVFVLAFSASIPALADNRPVKAIASAPTTFALLEKLWAQQRKKQHTELTLYGRNGTFSGTLVALERTFVVLKQDTNRHIVKTGDSVIRLHYVLVNAITAVSVQAREPKKDATSR